MSESPETAASLTERLGPGLTQDQLVLPPGAAQRLRIALGQGQNLANHPLLGPAVRGWLAGSAAPAGCVAAISGPRGSGRTALARAVGASLGLAVLRLRMTPQPLDLAALSREVVFHNGLLLIDEADRWLTCGDHGALALADWIPSAPFPVVLTCRDLTVLPAGLLGALQAHVALRWPGVSEREQQWEQHLTGDLPLHGEVDLSEMARCYPMPGSSIARAVRLAAQAALASPEQQLTAELLQQAAAAMAETAALAVTACQTQARGLDDLVLPADLAEKMGDLLRTVRARQRLGLHSGSGVRALVVLIDGPAGTGKSLAGHALAAELGLPLLRFRDSLPGQPPLERVRDLVRRGAETGALLLIDDAETLLGRRVQDPAGIADRHSALALDDVLALLDEHDGPLVWTTRAVGGLDPAALRAVHTRLTLPEPPPPQRARLLAAFLQRAKVPGATDLDLEGLGRDYALAGARLRNAVARAAAHCLAEGAAAVTQEHLLAALAEEAQAAGVVVWTQAGRKPAPPIVG